MPDIIDTRDLVEELEDEIEIERRLNIKHLFEEIRAYAGDDPDDGVTLINDSYFTRYAEEFADDIGAIDRKAGWPLSHIDWDAAADELKQDYTSVEFDGDTYWYR